MRDWRIRWPPSDGEFVYGAQHGSICMNVLGPTSSNFLDLHCICMAELLHSMLKFYATVLEMDYVKHMCVYCGGSCHKSLYSTCILKSTCSESSSIPQLKK